MKRGFLLAIVIATIMFVFSTSVKADAVADNYSESTKYLKTVTHYSNNILFSNGIQPAADYSVTYEVSEEEYNNAGDEAIITRDVYGVSETTYKRMTVSIAPNGSYYRYKNVLVWKTTPSVRSYDIIGIGFYSNLKLHSSFNFLQEYCYSGGSCTSTTTNYPQIFTAGAGTTFALPTGTINSLKETIWFDLEKKTTATLISQDAYGDYSHATSTISLNNAKKYTVVGSAGIVLDSSISSYYDSIGIAHAYWSGTW